MPCVVSVNVGQPRQISVRRGRPFMSSIVKDPVEGRVRATGANLEGDRQADLTVHGGADKAVYVYAIEDIAWWAQALERPEVGPGRFGENLTTEGLDVTHSVVGERWRIGETEFEVSQPRLPVQTRHPVRRQADGQGFRARLPTRRVPAHPRRGHGRRGRPDRAAAPAGARRDACSSSPTRSSSTPSLQPEAAKAPELAASLADELRAVA